MSSYSVDFETRYSRIESRAISRRLESDLGCAFADTVRIVDFGPKSAWFYGCPERGSVPLACVFGYPEDREEADGVNWICPHVVLEREDIREPICSPVGGGDEVGLPVSVNGIPARPEDVKWPKGLGYARRNDNVNRNVQNQGQNNDEAENERPEEVTSESVFSTVKEFRCLSPLVIKRPNYFWSMNEQGNQR